MFRAVSILLSIVVVNATFAAGCGDNTRADSLTIYTTADLEESLLEMMRLVPIESRVVVDSDPVRVLPKGDLSLAVTSELDCTSDCYEITAIEGGYSISSGTLIGAQYGLGQALEGLGIGFFHPHKTEVPAALGSEIDSSRTDELIEPEVARRGLHLHILHPIEPYFAFWEPGAENLEDAKRMVNWGILIGANYFQWTALDNILLDGEGEPWREHNQAIVDYIHARGAEVGVGVQLYGSSNLQNAYDLVDDPEGDVRVQIEERYPSILADAGWDHLSLSYGEFFGADPDKFITDTNLAVDVLGELDSDMTISATVHVGDDQRIDYMGDDPIYYFLVRYASEKIIPWIHTVMYYNLFEDAGGAYHHEDFADHREYLFDRMRAGEPVGYHPETAYWVAFDNSVPVYNPLYVRSRWLDLDRIPTEAGAALPEHIVFSTGWEWGYWQNDAAAFRQSVKRAPSSEAAFAQLFAPMGEAGQPLAQAAHETAELQHEYLLEKRLAGYLAGADVYIDAGYVLDIVSQPKPELVSEIVEYNRPNRQRLETDIIIPLEELAVKTDDIRDDLSTSALVSPWKDEMLDGLEATAARAQFVAASLRAAIEFAAGDSPEASLSAMEAAFDRGRAVVDRRHQNLWYPRPGLLLEGTFNSTLYQFGLPQTSRRALLLGPRANRSAQPSSRRRRPRRSLRQLISVRGFAPASAARAAPDNATHYYLTSQPAARWATLLLTGQNQAVSRASFGGWQNLRPRQGQPGWPHSLGSALNLGLAELLDHLGDQPQVAGGVGKSAVSGAVESVCDFEDDGSTSSNGFALDGIGVVGYQR